MKISKGRNGELVVVPKFVWGTVVEIHEITPDIHVVEYWEPKGKYERTKDSLEDVIMFHPFVATKDINRSCYSMEEAVITAIAIKYDGQNTQADYFFTRMVGMNKESK